MQAEVSLVVPVLNECENVSPFVRRVTPILERLKMPWEIIFVDDGSTDGTLDIIGHLQILERRIKSISFSRNFGKEAALSAGLKDATGEVIITMDADLQHPPELIFDFIEKWREGYDMVSAVRSDRRDESWLKRCMTGLFYHTLSCTATVRIPPHASDYRLLSRRVVDALNQLAERRRYMKGLFAWVGFRQAAIPYVPSRRQHGRTKWNLMKLFNLAIEGLTSFSKAPLQWIMYFGFVVAAVSFGYAGYTVAATLFFGDVVKGYPSTIVLILFLGGVQLLAVGFLGQYVGRIYDEVKQRPLYVVAEKAGFEEGLLEVRSEDVSTW